LKVKMSGDAFEERMMGRALRLAEKGRYSTSPNPMVGAVLVRGGRVVGEGFHRRAGEPHAELQAIQRAGGLARGATLFVTLEPCSHTARTGPCAQAVIEAGIARVVASRRDPNPAVAGRGFRRLRSAGLEVSTGLLAEEASRQNERFDAWVLRGRPFVLAKAAVTLDGRIADFRGRSRWISGSESRRRAMEWREEYDAVLVGAGTVEADDPLLTRRLGLNRATPHRRIVLDGRLRIPESARLFRDPEGLEIWTAARGAARQRRLEARGVRVRCWPSREAGRVDLRRALAALAAEEVTGLLVEGGRETLTSFAAEDLVDRWAFFLAPKILGGSGAPTPLGGRDVTLDRALLLRGAEWIPLGGDMLVTGRSRG
jgi:diaminohydroxyphosphoribosylaminopyrimidine deaminase/5-amino-6-(5-phosphoribosylamino)uracil reductase